MSRSRSSFDLSGAIATAASLSVVVPEEQPAALYRGVPLVSFGPTAAGPPTKAPPPEPVTMGETPKPPAQPAAPDGSFFEPEPPTQALPPEPPAPAVDRDPAAPSPAPAPAFAHPAEVEAGPADTARRPPKLPDLSEIKSPVVRCERIIEWIVEAVGASEIFIADAAGLPIAGAIADAESRLAAAGVVASSVVHLAAAIPGNNSALFELHIGDGPFFQLVGFEVGQASYVVGFHRPTPLGFRQAHAVRLACRHALTPGNSVADLGSAMDPRPPRSAETGGET